MPSRRPPVSRDRRFRQPQSMADHGTPERWQHGARLLAITERAGVLAARAATENVLDILLERGWITDRQQEAALLLRLDYHRAGLAARVSGSYSQTRQNFNLYSGWDERSEAEEIAYQRWRRAIQNLPMAIRQLAITVICHDEMPQLLQVPQLRDAMDCLAKKYGVPRREDAKPKC